MILINIQNKGNITVFEGEDIVMKMTRRTPIPFFKTIGEIFQNENKMVVIHYHFLTGKKIILQKFPFNVKILNQRWFSSNFDVDGNTIKIKHNPFFLFSKNFSKIYYNSNLIVEIFIKSKIDVSGYNLEVKFLTKNDQINNMSLLCFIIYSIEYNLS